MMEVVTRDYPVLIFLVVPFGCIFCWGDTYFRLPVFCGNLPSGFQGSDLEASRSFPQAQRRSRSPNIVLPGTENLQQ